MSEQPLTAFTKPSYGKQDFAKAEGHKTENGGGGYTSPRGRWEGKKIVPWLRRAKEREITG